MRKHIGPVLMGLGLVLIVSALGLIIRNQQQEQRSGEAAAQAKEAVTEQISVNTETAVMPGAPSKELPVEEIDGETYIGTLGLPVLELELPIMDDWSYARLRKAPCREYGTTARDMVIAGHNYKSHFGRLKTLVPGDLVTFTDMDGDQTAYEVGVVEIIQPTDVERVLDPAWDLVLYTCTYGGRTRVMVGCQALNL